jgi:hypothetical protein
MKWLHAMTLRKQLLLIVLIAALPSAIIIVHDGYRLRTEAVTDARQETQKLAALIASEHRYRVAAAEQLLKILAQLPEVKLRKAPRVETILKDILKLQTQYSNIFASDLDGAVWASALPSKGINVSDRLYFKKALISNRLSAGEYIVSRFTNKMVITFAYPYRNDEGVVGGVLCLGLDLDYYRHLLNDEELETGKSYLLLDHNGVVMARPIDPEAFVGKSYNEKQFKMMVQGPDENTILEKGIDAQMRFITYRKVRLEGDREPYLYIRAAIPVKTTLGAASYKMLMNMGMFFAFLVAALLVAWRVGKQSIADRVSVLESASRRMASGDLQVRVAGEAGGGELGNLGRNFDEMAAQIMVRDTEKSRLIDDLQKAIADIKTLRGIIPICSSCKKIRNGAGVWTNLESYISEHTAAEFSHGMCADCSNKMYPEYSRKKK